MLSRRRASACPARPPTRPRAGPSCVPGCPRGRPSGSGYSDHRWATYKQIKDMGGQVCKGERATHVLFYKFDDETQKAQDQPDRCLGAQLH